MLRPADMLQAHVGLTVGTKSSENSHVAGFATTHQGMPFLFRMLSVFEGQATKKFP